MDGHRRLRGPGGLPGKIDAGGWLDAVADAYNHGQDVHWLLAGYHDDASLIALELVQQRATDLRRQEAQGRSAQPFGL